LSAIWLASSSAHAAGFSVARFAGEHGHPTTDNPTALYHNPAALRSTRPELFVDGLFGLRRVTYTREAQDTDAAEVPGAEGANAGRATLTDAVASPSLWLVLPVTSRFTLAAGLFTPFGGPIKFDTRSDFEGAAYPGPLDGVQRFHAIEGSFTTSYGALGASYALGQSGLRLGAAFNAMYTRIDDVRAWSTGSNGVAGEGRSLLEVDGFSWGFGAGLLYEPESKRWRFGASYQSRPNVRGGMSLPGKLSNNIGGPSSAEVELHQDMPDIVRAGFAVRPDPGLELRLFGAWERWSAFDRQCVTQAGFECEVLADGSQPNGGHVLQNVPRHFQDAFEARVGLSVWTSPRLELFSGLGVMSQAVPDDMLESSLPDFFGVTFSLGAKAKLTDVFSVAGALSHIVAPARDVDDDLSSFALPTKLPDATGHYTQSVSYLDVNVAVRF
jgi:long-chain fatty acid transport protein